MKLCEDFCLFLNNLFPKRGLPGRESMKSYSEAQYGWAESSYKLYASYLELKDKKVLDAGCGPGGKTVFYAEKGCKHIIGIDIDETRLNAAKEYAREKNIANTEFIVGSFDALPFQENTFDIIFLNDVIEHISRPILMKALEEFKRIIKPGGKICLEFPPWTSSDAAHLYDYIYIPWCQVLFSAETLINVLKRMEAESIASKLSAIEHFQQLNRITIKDFKHIVKILEFKVIKIDLQMRSNLARYIPVVNQYMVSRVIGVLSK